MSEQQAVTATADAQAAPGAEVSGAPEKSVDDLLKEFDTSNPEPTTETAPEGDDRLNKVFDYVERKASEEVAEQTSKDIADAVKTTVGDSGLDPEYVEGKLHFKANKDPKFAAAWMSRHEKPDLFKEVLTKYGKELSEKAGSNIDQAASEDRAAVAAAVRSQNTAPADPGPSEKDIAKMSDAEFKKHKDSLLGR